MSNLYYTISYWLLNFMYNYVTLLLYSTVYIMSDQISRTH
jgi:hypothetical protein